MVPLFDPAPQHVRLAEEVHAATKAVLESGRYILGENVAAFEDEVAAYHGHGEAVGVASGTDALHLALLAVGVEPGDEVITSPFSFIAGVEAILYCGARPVFVDIHPDTLNLDEQALESAISSRTRAIMPVHLFGLPAAMPVVMAVARRHGLPVVEDCAQAFGARIGEQAVGTFGDAGCYSFFPTKNLGGYGDGGLVLCRDSATADAVRTLRNHGSREPYRHARVGYNSRLDELQAAILRVKLRHLDAFNASRREVADWYCQDLASLSLQLPSELPDRRHVYGQFTVRLADRDRVREALGRKGIGTAVYYPVPLHRQPVCAENGSEHALPNTDAVAGDCLSLPMFPGMTREQAEEVVAGLAAVLGRTAATG